MHQTSVKKDFKKQMSKNNNCLLVRPTNRKLAEGILKTDDRQMQRNQLNRFLCENKVIIENRYSLIKGKTISVSNHAATS